MKTSIHRILHVVPVLLAAPVLSDQTSLMWFTVDGGGGHSAGGVYSVTGTIGQPDAGRLSGGSFVVEGGFWAGFSLIQTPGAPELRVVHSNQVCVVYWPLPASGWLLDWAPLCGSSPGETPWHEVPAAQYQTNATHICFSVAPSAAGKAFFRLRKP